MNVRTILVAQTDRLDAIRIMLEYCELPGISDNGEVDNLTPDSQIVTLTVNGTTTEYRAVILPVPAETAVALEALFDPPAEIRAEWNDRIDAQRLKAATLRAIRAKAPADRTPEERAQLREARKDLPGNLPTVAQFRAAARACRFFTLSNDDNRSLERWFRAKPRADQGWAWVEMPGASDSLRAS
jgi:hypothetical protein